MPVGKEATKMCRLSIDWFKLFAFQARTILVVLLLAVPLVAQRPDGPPGSPLAIPMIQ